MLAAVRGSVVGVLPDGILLEMGPVTLQISVSNTTLSALPRDGSTVRLVTHLYRMLLAVTGVGPKVALNVCGSAEPDVIIGTIAAGDIDALARVPGIGKKTAARLVLELRGKLDSLVTGTLPTTVGGASADDTTEVIAALQALGYTTTEAFTAMRDADIISDMTVEQRVFAALRHIGQAR